MATKQPPSVIRALREQYDELRGGMSLTAGLLRQTCALLGHDLRKPRDLIPALRRALDARFEEGRVDSLDFGEVLDPASGQLRPVAAKRPPPPPPREPATTPTSTQGEPHGKE